jgi:hypothetical protein
MRRVSIGAVLPVLTVFALGCSSSSSPSSSSSNSPGGTSSAPAKALTSANVSGKWSGHYSGTFSGTFTVNWTESGSGVSGTIAISQLGNAPTPISGTLHGNSISFGTVGSEAITYTGTVSSASMSGTWKIAANGQSAGGGSWTASKSS